jgi:shikimate dehydrogenase
MCQDLSSQVTRIGVPSANVSGSTRVIGVFGHPVEHSLSPAMHNAAIAALLLPYIYVPFSVAPENLPTAINSLNALGIVGVNLTIPHKEAVLPHLQDITDEAREAGAVNTVHCIDGRLLGDNTDGYGFYAPLEELGWSAAGKRVVVLGAGGAARAVVFRLAREGAQVFIHNRSVERAARLVGAVTSAGYNGTSYIKSDSELREALAAADLLVNATRVGMHPDTEASPELPFELLSERQMVYDLVYTPIETALLRKARERGCKTVPGVKMLVHQGAASFHRWTGKWPPADVMERAVMSKLI